MKHTTNLYSQMQIKRRSAQLFLVAIFTSAISFAQVTKSVDKQPPLKKNITSEVQTAINSNQSTLNSGPVHIGHTDYGGKLFLVFSGGKPVNFQAKDANGKPLPVSIARTKTPTGLKCTVCISGDAGGAPDCYEVDCSLILKMPEKKSQ